MEYHFKFDPRAIAAAVRFHDQIAERSPDRAAKWWDGLFQSIETLKKFPLRCPLASESEAYGEVVREHLYGKRRSIYRVLFTIREDLIVILAIKHAAEGPSDLPP